MGVLNAEIISSTVLMIVWLTVVAIFIYYALEATKHSKNYRKNQFYVLSIATIIIFIGDTIHTIGFDISKINNNPLGLIGLGGSSTFSFYNFSLFFDGLAFIIYYTLWIFVLAFRYQEGQLLTYDKFTLGIAIFSIFSNLLSPFINIPGVNYTIAVYSLHIIAFIIFGLMVVLKLFYNSKNKRKTDNKYKNEEKLLYIASWGYIFSFLFFILTLALLPINSLFGLMMVPKTLAYMVSFISIIILLKDVKKAS